MVTWYRVHSVIGGKWLHNINGNMVQSTPCYGWVLCTMLPLRLWIHFPAITRCTLYHVIIEVVNSLPTHSRVYSVPCYHFTLLWVGCEFTTSMATWYRVHTAMGGKWIDNFNGNMVQSTHCYGWEVNWQLQWSHGTEYCTLYHVTIEVDNSLPTHSRVYSVPCYHWSYQFTSHP
jgi:hypothetical protein